MNAISLWQPWATLVAIGAKRIETRSWPLYFDGPFAIHAAKKWDKKLEALCFTEPFFKHLNPLRPNAAASFKAVLPFGAIIATCDWARPSQVIGHIIHPQLADGYVVSGDEIFFGDYSTGRFGSHLGTVNMFAAPIPYRGAQGPFNVPDELIASSLSAPRSATGGEE